MQGMLKVPRSKPGRRLPCLAGIALTTLGLSGCADFWDQVTSREFKVKQLWVRRDPMEVLRTSTDGDERAKALRGLKEPKQHGGTDREQDEVVGILTKTATSDKQPLCRLAAIQALGNFKDARAVEALSTVFYDTSSAARSRQDIVAAVYNPVNFTPDITTNIRCQALRSLGETGNPAALKVLMLAVGEPKAEGPEQDRQQVMDVRITAARALGNFKEPQSNEALVRVLKTEKDVALRACAREALEESTGKKVPPELLGPNAPPEPNIIQKVVNWF